MDLDLSWLPPKETEEMELGPGSENAEALNIVDRSWNSSSSAEVVVVVLLMYSLILVAIILFFVSVIVGVRYAMRA